jgi:AraC-like DNA-binding protein/mannose-6-phosphate isomerase-like protein (cupin superfamily)
MPKLIQLETGFHDTMQRVSSARARAVTVGVNTKIAGWELELHHHEKAQLMMSIAGVALCEAESAIWLVPPGAAVIVPSGVEHRVAVQGKIEGYAVFIATDMSDDLPRQTTTITVNPLLRELIIRSAHFPIDYSHGGVESRVMELLLEELAVAPTGGLHLPMPSDPRLRVVFQSMMTNPSERGTIETWSKRVGLSQRSLARMISTQTGMSFGRWRERLSIILALQWMAAGTTVEKAAFDLGYENPGSFIRMFHKAMGASPARYVAEHAGE